MEFESLPVWLKHRKAEHGFCKRFSNSLFLSPSVFQTRIASATSRSFKDTFIYVHLNLTSGFKLVAEQSTESITLLVMSLHPRGSQSIFQVFQAVVTDFTKATAWKAAQTTLIFLHPSENVLLEFTEDFQMDSLFIPIFPPNRQVGLGGSRSVCSAPAVQLAGSLRPLQVRQFLSDQRWLPGKGHPGRALHCQGRGAARERRGTGTWKTRRLGQKERTPLGNL